MIKACAELNRGQYEYHDVERIVWRMNRLLPLWEVSFSTDEILDIVDKDGVPQSDDGSFSLIVRNDRKYVKHEPNPNKPAPAAHGSNFGEIGSALPATTSATSSTFRRYLPSPPPGFWDV